ncbi:uncharacterized protein LOC132702323 isoform X2 [Cylas formicarius]|uniref:uncharacterized protein LOC132702323 isoform X2 n=1 Tax=Cylas formicarius TaxID=197179 RepID=UPI002958BC31|nr:uncharacterized protein LOC132702323 isoform X2 [Cylas formicarius]
MARRCCVKNCPNTDFGVCLFQFPTDLDLCEQWIKHTKNLEFLDEFAYGGALAFLKRFICQFHFSENDFFIKGDPTSGLKPSAVPKTRQGLRPRVGLGDIELIICPNPGGISENSTVRNLKDPLADLQLPHLENAARISQKMRSKRKSEQNMLKARERQETEIESQKPTRRCKNGAQETDEERARRRERDKMKMRLYRSKETPEQREERRRKDRERARRYYTCVPGSSDEEVAKKRQLKALDSRIRRSKETEEQREERRRKDRVRNANKRRLEKLFQNVKGSKSVIKTEVEIVKHELES